MHCSPIRETRYENLLNNRRVDKGRKLKAFGEKVLVWPPRGTPPTVSVYNASTCHKIILSFQMDVKSMEELLAEKKEVDAAFDAKIWDMIDALREVKRGVLPRTVAEQVAVFSHQLQQLRREDDDMNYFEFNSFFAKVEELRDKGREEKLMDLKKQRDDIDEEICFLQTQILRLVEYIREYRDQKASVPSRTSHFGSSQAIGEHQENLRAHSGGDPAGPMDLGENPTRDSAGPMDLGEDEANRHEHAVGDSAGPMDVGENPTSRREQSADDSTGPMNLGEDQANRQEHSVGDSNGPRDFGEDEANRHEHAVGDSAGPMDFGENPTSRREQSADHSNGPVNLGEDQANRQEHSVGDSARPNDFILD
uniref:THO complex subunit 7 n=1 Tax=Steinernema glaseri TaxID=37863 RepID=A0A1I8ACZ2_9BILA